MNSFIKRNLSYIIMIFILLGPIIDLLTGLCLHLFEIKLTVGIFIRLLFMLFICYTSLFVYDKKKLLIPYSLFFVYMILYVLGIIVYKDGLGLMTEVQGLIKVFYFPILLVSLFSIRENVSISPMTLFTTLFLYLIFIFVPLLLGIGYETYEITKAGTLGFYNSANEISGIISLLTPIMFIIIVESKKIIPSMILIIMYLIVILMIGTKTPLLSLMITLGFAVLYFWIHSIKAKKYKNIAISLGIIMIAVAGLICIIPKTTFYQNIEVHLKFLKVDEVEDIVESEKVFDHFIFSQRLTFKRHRLKDYKKASLYQKAFGIGYLKKGKETKMIEMDYFDILYNHGLIGFIIFFGTFIYVVYKVFMQKKAFTFSRYMFDVSLVLIVLLSFFTGHILVSPAVSLLVIIIILSLYRKNKKRILLIANYDERPLEKDIFIKELNKVSYLDKLFVKDINYFKQGIYKIFNYKNYDLNINYSYHDVICNEIMNYSADTTGIYVKNGNDKLVESDYVICDKKIKNIRGKVYTNKDFLGGFR
ncbi:MAG: O-antigen ligase family protein [Bacilli bacterium]|nr:O-antigen ligase family protein [Bacilli bacterium]